MAKYKIADNAPVHQVEHCDEKTGIWSLKLVKGIRPFGAQCGVITDEKLTEPIAEWLLTKEEFKNYIVVEKQFNNK